MTYKEKASALFEEGYNCSQAVFTAFCDRFSIDEDTAKKISAGLGGGVGRQREVCGAVSGAVMVIGSLAAAISGDDSESKKKNYELVREFSDEFRAFHGSIICREILKSASVTSDKTATPQARTAEYYKKRPCLRAVEDAAEILTVMIDKYEKETK